MTAGAELHAAAIRIRLLPKRTLIQVAKAAKAEAARVGAGYGAPLKGHKRRGMNMKARDTIRETADGATVRIQAVNPSAWVWMTTGTAGHPIRRRKRGRKSKMTVHHPGTRGRGAWDRVTEQVETVIVPRVLLEELARAMGRLRS